MSADQPYVGEAFLTVNLAWLTPDDVRMEGGSLFLGPVLVCQVGDTPGERHLNAIAWATRVIELVQADAERRAA